MVVEYTSVISAIRKIVGGGGGNTAVSANANRLQCINPRQAGGGGGDVTGGGGGPRHAMETMPCIQDDNGTRQSSTEPEEIDLEQEVFAMEKGLIRQSKSAKMARRKRVVSECASVIADPMQAVGQPPGCLRWRTWLPTVLRLPCLVGCLYLFICSLEVLSTSFRLMAGKTAGSIFRENPLLVNPVVGLMMGVLFTVLVQSSSTCTSVIVSMVSSGILEVRNAIPMIMGANIGTSLTNTLVSFSQVTDRDQFERAFAGATVHDCFNWLTVSVLLSVEVCTGYLYHLTGWLTEHLELEAGESTAPSVKPVNLLGALTKPLTHKIVQINKPVLKCWALGGCQEERLLKVWCPVENGTLTYDLHNDSQQLAAETDFHYNSTNGVDGEEKCDFLLNYDGVSDFYLGLVLFGLALGSLSTCLIFIVKLLHSLLQGTVAELAKKTINSEVPGLPWLSGYIAILAGALLTFLVQSSSVFTSTITPLVGLGLISVDRMYPLTLGSNIGTTTTALLASLSADPGMLRNSLQIALCHLTFNLHGILLFYPIPAMRWPLGMCKVLGRTTAQYRWFAIVYLLIMFVVAPGLVLGLSMAGSIVLTCTLLPCMALGALVVLVNVMQVHCPDRLPSFLLSWKFLPEWMRSLDPMDRLIQRLGCLNQYREIEEPTGGVVVGAVPTVSTVPAMRNAIDEIRIHK